MVVESFIVRKEIPKVKLELGSFSVDDVQFSDVTQYSRGVLYIDKNEVVSLIKEDTRFETVDLHLVHPGDSTRLMNVVDAVEPRYKVSGPGAVFPGLLNAPTGVGEGRTHRLSGVVVVETSIPVFNEPTFWRDSILDMTGPGSAYNQFGNLLNIVLELRPKSEFTSEETARLKLKDYNRGPLWVQDYHRGVRVAALKLASYLAETTKDLTPDSVRTYELTPATSNLPKVAYSFQLHQHLVYGLNLGWVPTLLHPNELADGIIVDPYNPPAGMRDSMFTHQNHPVVERLYNSHGKDIDFKGIMLYRAQVRSLVDKERTTDFAANILRIMKVDGVVMTWTGGGNPGMDIMMLAKKCENFGIKASILNTEMSGKPGDTGFVDYVDEADAIVNVGNFEEVVKIPAVNKLIGGTRISEPDLDATQEIELPLRYLYGATNPMGSSNLGGVQY